MTFIDDHRDEYGVEPICKVIPLAPSTYYAHKAWERKPESRSVRAQRADELRPDIRRVRAQNFELYGGAEPSVGSKGDSYDTRWPNR